MQLQLHTLITDAVTQAAASLWGIEAGEVVLNQTPKVGFGELATPLCLGLAKTLGKPPRAIAEELAGALQIDGVRKTEVAGPGYINFYLDRSLTLRRSIDEFASGSFEAFTPRDGKVVVEHTNINPNKAAHIGHLRNAAIGDTFSRVLRFVGHDVEIQNYIDNTGVQVADVIVGFQHIERLSNDEVRILIQDSSQKFDYYCWDLYAKAGTFYEESDPEHLRRAETLRAIEAGNTPTARMAEDVAMAIVRCHLRTMERINVQYDLLPRESDILHLKFWERAFELLKDRKAIFLENTGKNAGCWVMKLDTEGAGDDKIIVRSDHTVTYVGKDIAYQLWKLGLLTEDFRYRLMETHSEGGPVWVSSSDEDTPGHPSFGHGSTVYNVIDVRQSYPQTVVKQGVRALGFEREAERSVHLSYEMVALTPACARQLGIELPAEDRKKPYVEVSGRKGQGVKADDLLDILEEKAQEEVGRRNPDFAPEEQNRIAREISVGALRYFLLRFTRNAVIAFDFDEALNFDGETGPYIQYAGVRANNILKRAEGDLPGYRPEQLRTLLESPRLDEFLDESDEVWELVYLAARLDETAMAVATTMEPATLARFGFNLAQKFSLFYHRHRVLSESDPERRLFYLLLVDFVRQALGRTLDLMGIAIPIRM